MRIAVISDVHGNVPALEAVAHALRPQDPELVVCLGDTVGYGPQPSEALRETVALADLMVAGNHDLDIAGEESSQGCSGAALASHRWSRERMKRVERSFLAQLPRRARIADSPFVAVHGCFLNTDHVWGYVTPDMAPANLERLAAEPGAPLVGLCGHTHQPLLAWLDADGNAAVRPALRSGRWPADARAVLVNPGSVGQPRDGDPRAAFAIVDDVAREVTIHRVGYRVRSVAGRILEAGLPSVLAERLVNGR